MADGHPYCHRRRGGDVICEIMPLMSAFLGSVRRLLPSTVREIITQDLCKYMGKVSSNTFEASVITNKRLLWLADLFLIVQLKYMCLSIT